MKNLIIKQNHFGIILTFDCAILCVVIGKLKYTRYSRKVPGLIHFKGYLTSNHYEVFQITIHTHFLYFSDKLRKEYARIVLKCRLTYGINTGTEHFEKPLNRIFLMFSIAVNSFMKRHHNGVNFCMSHQ